MRLLIAALVASVSISQLAAAQGTTSTTVDPVNDFNSRIELNAFPVLLKGFGISYEVMISPKIGVGPVIDTFAINSDSEQLVSTVEFESRIIRGGVKSRFYLNDPRRESSLYATLGAMYAKADGKAKFDSWTDLPSSDESDSMFGVVAGAGYHVLFESTASRQIVLAFGAAIEPASRIEWTASSTGGQTQSEMDIGYGLGLEASLGVIF